MGSSDDSFDDSILAVSVGPDVETELGSSNGAFDGDSEACLRDKH